MYTDLGAQDPLGPSRLLFFMAFPDNNPAGVDRTKIESCGVRLAHRS